MLCELRSPVDIPVRFKPNHRNLIRFSWVFLRKKSFKNNVPRSLYTRCRRERLLGSTGKAVGGKNFGWRPSFSSRRYIIRIYAYNKTFILRLNKFLGVRTLKFLTSYGLGYKLFRPGNK